MAKRQALGKGLSSLIPEPRSESGSGPIRLDVGVIDPNPGQPRRSFTEEAIAELAASIREHGVLQPVVVRRQGARYELIVGERRWRAAIKAGMGEIPAVVRDLDDRQRLEVALVENIQRADLNALEEARACATLAADFGLSHDVIAERIGKSRPHVTNLLRLLTLDRRVHEMIVNGDLTLGHAKALTAVKDPEAQFRMAQAVVARGLNVRRTETAIGRLDGTAGGRKGRAGRKSFRDDPNVRDAERRLKEALGTDVLIRGRAERGRIEIEFTGLKELQRLFDLLATVRAVSPAPPASRGVTLPGRNAAERAG